MTNDARAEEPRIAAPLPSALVESLRGVGYSLPDAIADLIDNSISAGAANVWLHFEWNGPRSHISVLDDGRGMSSDGIVEAMRFGTLGPGIARSASDLGRFGLGLKTASFSQCRRLTVAAQTDHTGVAAWRWDLDYLARSTDWYILPGAEPGSERLLHPLSTMQKGTLILWEVLDRVVPGADVSDRRAQDAFLAHVDAVDAHLAATFHRYLDGPSPHLRVFINGTSDSCRVKPWDPFLKNHPLTMPTPIERIRIGADPIELQGYVLPHPDRLDGVTYRTAGGVRGWVAQQGFYLYRNRRLLVGGSWLGLGDVRPWPKEEIHKLARIRLDIPNTQDHDWKIDIKKSRATPPAALMDRLSGLATVVRGRARRVMVSRGSRRPDSGAGAFFTAWTVRETGGGIQYRINREHPAIHHILNTAGEHRAAVEAVLQIIEQAVPIQRIWLDMTEQSDAGRAEPTTDPETMRPVMQAVFDDLIKGAGLLEHQAKRVLSTMEPFQRHPDIILQLTPTAS